MQNVQVPAGAMASVLNVDPGIQLRAWIALILRMSLGLNLVQRGVMDYMGGGNFGRTFGSPFNPLAMIGPVIEICVGMALIVGFLTTIAAILAAGYSLVVVGLQVFGMIVSASIATPGRMWGGMGNYNELALLGLTSTGAAVIHQVAVIWFSPVEVNRYSVDRLIFTERREQREQRPLPPIQVERPRSSDEILELK